MELDENINWGAIGDEAVKSSWCLTEELFDKFSLKAPLCEKETQKPKESLCPGQQVEDILKAKNTLYPQPRLLYPKKSDLSIEDQKFFLETYKDFISGKDIAFENVNRLQSLMWTLKSEQNVFATFLQQHSLLLKDDYNHLHPRVKETVQKFLRDQRSHVVQRLPAFYTLFQTVGLSTGAVFPNDPIFCYVSTLKQAAEQPLLSLPCLEESQIYLAENSEDDERVVSPTPLYQDSYARNFSGEHGVHFVLTAGALETLIDNHQPAYEKEWEFPISVVDHSESCTDTTSTVSKTIMIDDPLPRKTITPREMNVVYYQHELCRLLRNASSNSYGNCASAQSSHNLSQEHDQAKEIVDYGLASEGSQGKESKSAEAHLQLATKAVISDQEEGKNNKNQSNNETQFTYSIWTFGHLKLLVRSTYDGLFYQPSKEEKCSLHQVLRQVNIFVKPEYQLMFGYEQITPSEASRWWMNCYINRDSLCLCARVDPLSSKLLRIDVLNQTSIVNTSSFNPAQPMKMIHGVLSRLEKLLEPGKYILSHCGGDMHTCIYEVVNDEQGTRQRRNASYDLRAESHKCCLVNYQKSMPWVAIDPNMFLEWHITHDRLPMTFPAVSNEELKKELKSSLMKKKKGKKNKKKQCNFKGKKVAEISIGDKGVDNRTFIGTKDKGQRNRPTNKGELVQLDRRDGSMKPETSYSQVDSKRISERLRNRLKPVTYDDIHLDF